MVDFSGINYSTVDFKKIGQIGKNDEKKSELENGLTKEECDIVDAQGNVTGKIVNFCYSDGDVLESREYNSNGEMIARERLFVNTKTDTLHKKNKS